MSTSPPDKELTRPATPTELERGHVNGHGNGSSPRRSIELADFGIDANDQPPDQVDSKGRRPLRLGTKEEWAALAALYCSMFLAGWNDATIGPLLLRMQSHYGVGRTSLPRSRPSPVADRPPLHN